MLGRGPSKIDPLACAKVPVVQLCLLRIREVRSQVDSFLNRHIRKSHLDLLSFSVSLIDLN